MSFQETGAAARRSATLPKALIIRPKEKSKYADILTRIKKDVYDDQVRSTVEKIRKTELEELLIVLTKKNTDRGKSLQKTIADLLEIAPKSHEKGGWREITYSIGRNQEVLGKHGKIRIGWVDCHIKAVGASSIGIMDISLSIAKVKWIDPNIASSVEKRITGRAARTLSVVAGAATPALPGRGPRGARLSDVGSPASVIP
ncbi:hypothetical protein EVAR_55785_1 [Eumeta japonica]|uniref:Uncharacterized protein n=1 Tax=Eumeta variegata TaxID=151549 RepID=A0A4C1YVC4_EUMVA|nr:hypothetical protein EVAR_55785_1 [Eumeta japonica]